MKKNPLGYIRMVAAILVVLVLGVTTSFAQTQSEESKLINRMMNDGLIDQVKGFLVEKKQHDLYIDGKQQTADVAGKYLASIEKENISVWVKPIQERLKDHQGTSLNTILFPVSFNSGCVQSTGKKKKGC